MNSELYIPHTNYLKNIIRSIWQVNDPLPHKNETIIPKGIVEIIFDLAENNPVQSNIDNKNQPLTRCFINGFNTGPIHLYIPKRHFFFGVQIHPAAVKYLFGMPAAEFSNLAIDLTLLNPFFNSLWHHLAEVKTFNERVAAITAWIETKIFQPHPQELLLNSFLANNQQHAIQIKELAQTLCYSPRHLSRKTYELTGMNTEQFLLYKKYLRAVHLIHSSNAALTEIAYQSNFADQSHFIKSFKAFAHITPNQYRQNKSNIPGHIFKNVR